MSQKKVIVIGAGIAGLVAAYRLKQQGHEVTVIESTTRHGGRMSTDIENGQVADRGAQFLVSSYTTMMPLIKELGLEAELTPTLPYSAFIMNGKINRVRHEFIHSRVLFLLKSTGSIVQFFKGLWSGIPLLAISRTAKDDYTLWAKYDTEDAATWFTRKFNKRALEYAMEPMLQGFFFHHPEGCSKAMASSLLAFNLNKGTIMTMKHGLGSVTQALAKKLNIHYEEQVTAIQNSVGKVQVTSTKNSYQADYAVIATPAPITQTIYQPTAIVEKRLLETKYASTLLVTLACDRNWSKTDPQLKGVYGILVPRKERKLICAIGIETSKHKTHTNAGELISIMTEGLKTPALLTLNDEEIISQLLPEIEAIFPGVSNSIIYRRVVRWPYAQTLSPVGRAKNIKSYRQQVSNKHPIVLAGDYMGIGSTDSAAHTGEWAASAIQTMIEH